MRPGDRLRLRSRWLALPVLAMPLGLAGCPGAYLATPILMTAPVGVPAAVTVGTFLSYGPTVTIENSSDVPVEVRVWVAKVDAFSPTGFTDQRTRDNLAVTAPAGEITRIQAGHAGWPTGQSDGVVWVRLQTSEGVEWYEFQRPGPYRVVVRRADIGQFEPGPIVYRSGNAQAMTPLPESAWIEHHDGRFAITGSTAVPNAAAGF